MELLIREAQNNDIEILSKIATDSFVNAYKSTLSKEELLQYSETAFSPLNIQEILKDGKHALLYTPNNARELADKIDKLYSDPQLRQQLGLAAKRLIEERGFYWRSNAARIIDLLERNDIQN